MSILENIDLKIQAEKNDPTGKVARDLKDEAIAAILGGIESSAWAKYMNNFVANENAAQLARLTAKDAAGEDPYMRKALAYLVANAVCGPDTITTTRFNLVDPIDESSILDVGL